MQNATTTISYWATFEYYDFDGNADQRFYIGGDSSWKDEDFSHGPCSSAWIIGSEFIATPAVQWFHTNITGDAYSGTVRIWMTDHLAAVSDYPGRVNFQIGMLDTEDSRSNLIRI